MPLSFWGMCPVEEGPDYKRGWVWQGRFGCTINVDRGVVIYAMLGWILFIVII